MFLGLSGFVGGSMSAIVRGAGYYGEEVSDLEERLERVYVPVQPRAEFRRELKTRLLREPESSLAEQKAGLLQYTLLTAAGLVSGTILLIFGVKAVNHFKTQQVGKAPAPAG
jgi:hypothetical protein